LSLSSIDVVKYTLTGMAATRTRARAGAAREAQRYFFEIGMHERQRAAAALAELDLTFPQAHILRLLEPGRPLPMSALAERLVCDASNVTGLADRLEARGLVARQPTANDRRVKALAITPAGAALRKRALQVMTDPPAAIAALSAEDQEALRDILARAVENLAT
jgi:DNA-binding MarR family transcriptional regulator